MSLWMEYYSATIQLKGNELKFPVVLLTGVQLSVNFWICSWVQINVGGNVLPPPPKKTLNNADKVYGLHPDSIRSHDRLICQLIVVWFYIDVAEKRGWS